MRLLIILCSLTLFLCAECGLLKSVLDTVSNEVHKIKDGNVVENVVNIVRNETKGIVEDLGDLLHTRKNQNDKKIKPTVTDKDKKVEEIPNSTRKPVTIQDSTAKIDKDEHIQPVSNNQDHKIHPATEETVNKIPDNTNQAVDSTQISSESSDTNRLVFNDEDYNYGEGTIVPRTARHIKVDNKTKQDAGIEQTIEKDDKKIIPSAGEEIIYANTNVTEFFLNNDDFDDINFDSSNVMPPGNASVETIVVGDCPEGSEISVDGLCVETSTSRVPAKAKNRANFVGGCLHGFGQADDGTCQEIIYD
ncbi:uncharacterized protein LOC135193860 [Vanessa tameamea]|uniref:Uncharacterized protein LOC135193860 n=1 Tax=Vanessa tameamea TaxID=334116 RepID=A0ABM4AS71_VANTA